MRYTIAEIDPGRNEMEMRNNELIWRALNVVAILVKFSNLHLTACVYGSVIRFGSANWTRAAHVDAWFIL